MKRLKLALIFLFLSSAVIGQTLSGRIFDAYSLESLPGASISISPGNLGAAADSSGRFFIEDLDPGYYQLLVSYIGYEETRITDIWIRNGNPVELEIAMTRQVSQLTEVVVRGRQEQLELGRLSITEEQVNRFAATYYDPARLITNSPDIAITNDQNNRVSVRGFSPNYNVWRLQGVELVNPNHLTNAGTFSDEPIATGGSVNIISAQMLGRSDFVYGDFQPKYGNSLGGIFDMNLKKGNQRKRHHVVQASLIGIDLASEGPFSENSKASYAVNYRYSFTGLLTNLGVDFGGESIGFQDLSFNISLPFENNSELQVFGLGGLNFNNFDARTLDESEIAKDRSDIYLDGKMGGTGASYRHRLGSGYANHSVAISASQNIRDQNYYDSTQTLFQTQRTDQVNQIVSWHSQFTSPVGKGHLNYGIMANYYLYQGGGSIQVYSVEQFLINPHLNLNYQLLDRLNADVGVNFLTNDNGNNAVDPRIGLTYYLNNQVDLYLKGGMFSQLLNPFNYYFVFADNGGDYLATGKRYDFQRSARLSIGAVKRWQNMSLELEGFFYQVPDINAWDGTTEISSTANSTGLSMVLNKNYNNNWYINGGGSFYNSTWGDPAIDNRYNTVYNLNVNGGKEWIKNKETKIRVFSVNTRIMYQGGLKDPFYTMDDLISPIPQTRVVTNNTDFFRIDLRIQWTWNKNAKSSSLALDFQNLTNTQNESYMYLDLFTGSVETQYQLGLIPILTYRVEF